MMNESGYDEFEILMAGGFPDAVVTIGERDKLVKVKRYGKPSLAKQEKRNKDGSSSIFYVL